MMNPGKHLRSQVGAASVAMILGIVAMIVTFGFAVLLLSNTETLKSQLHRSRNDVFFVADSGRRIAERCFQDYLLGSVKQNLPTSSITENVFNAIVNNKNTLLFLSYGGIGVEPTEAAANTLIESVKYKVIIDGYGSTGLIPGSSTSVLIPIGRANDGRAFEAEILVKRNGDPEYDADSFCWKFPIMFDISVRASAPIDGKPGSTPGTPRLAHFTTKGRGTVTLFVSKRSFADYLEYTQDYMRSDGGFPSMKARDTYDGPVHTSGFFRFMGKPGTWFKNIVTTAKTKAYFLDPDNNNWYESDKEYYPQDAKNQKQYKVYPRFDKGYFMQVVTSALSYDNFEPFRSFVRGDMTEPSGMGNSMRNIYMNTDNSTGELNGGGIWVVGRCGIELRMNGTKQEYLFTHYDDSNSVLGYSFVTVDIATNQTAIQRRDESSPTVYTGLPDIDKSRAGSQNGIYVKGAIHSLKGVPSINVHSSLTGRHIAIDTELTILARDGITITGDILYHSDPRTNTSAANILGIISETADVTIEAASPPDNFNINAHIFTGSGQFGCAHYSGALKNQVNLFGSVTGKYAGEFGRNNTGYAKNFVWDTRAAFLPPPRYPTADRYSVIIENPANGRSTWRILWAQD